MNTLNEFNKKTKLNEKLNKYLARNNSTQSVKTSQISRPESKVSFESVSLETSNCSIIQEASINVQSQSITGKCSCEVHDGREIVNKIVYMKFNDVKRILYDETEFALKYFQVQKFQGNLKSLLI